MKRLKAFFLSFILFCCVIIPVSACNNAQEYTKYKIVAVYNESEKTIDATVEVLYINPSDIELNEVMFHLYPRAFREGAKFSPVPKESLYEAYPNGKSYGDLTVLKVIRDGEEKEIKFSGQDEDILLVPGTLLPASATKIEIEFSLKLPTIRHRFGYFDGIVNLGNWYPIACAIVGGQQDTSPYYSNGDPFISDIADYEVQITVPEKYQVATSGRQTEIKKDGQKTVTSKISKARDFALVIGEFEQKTVNHNGIEINYYYKQDTDATFQVQTAIDALDTFSNLFGQYAYDTLSVVKTPFLYGGMEYPGLVYVSDSLNQSLFTDVIVHEIAHQWWYAAVGNDQIREAWLDEALADYSTTIFYEFNPSYNVDSKARLADAQVGYILYCERYKNNGKDDTSMNRSLPQYQNTQEYQFLIYAKGQLMFDLLRKTIGDEAFFFALKSYYKKYKFSRATGDDLIGELEFASKTHLKGYFESWLDGKAKMFAS